jgi:hypothetical protein
MIIGLWTESNMISKDDSPSHVLLDPPWFLDSGRNPPTMYSCFPHSLLTMNSTISHTRDHETRDEMIMIGWRREGESWERKERQYQATILWGSNKRLQPKQETSVHERKTSQSWLRMIMIRTYFSWILMPKGDWNTKFTPSKSRLMDRLLLTQENVSRLNDGRRHHSYNILKDH